VARPATGNLREIRSKRTGEVISYSARVTYNGRRRNVPLRASERSRAEREMELMVDEIRRGIWVEPLAKKLRRPASFGVFSEEWLARQLIEGGRQRIGLSPAAEAELRWALGHLNEHFARAPIDAITIADVDRYRLAKAKEGKLSANSINKTLTTLSSVLEMGVEYELIERNPAKGRRRRLAAVRPARPWLDRADHIQALLDGAAQLDHEATLRRGQRRALLATLVFAGLRLGEALALRWVDVDLTASTIHIREAKTHAGVRRVDLLPVLRGDLHAYKASLQDPTDALLFATRDGRPLNPSNVRQRIFARATQHAEAALRQKDLAPLPAELSPHSLRRTFASLLFALGEPPPYVMSQMGHTTPALTLAIYARTMHRRDGENDRLRVLANGQAVKRQLPTRSTSSTASAITTVRAAWSNQP
jgi:integrase